VFLRGHFQECAQTQIAYLNRRKHLTTKSTEDTKEEKKRRNINHGLHRFTRILREDFFDGIYRIDRISRRDELKVAELKSGRLRLAR